MSAGLYYSRAYLDISDLDVIALHLILFSESVFISGLFDGASDAASAKLSMWAEADLISPWYYPNEDSSPERSPWTSQARVEVTIAQDAYREYSAAIAESVAEFRERTRGEGGEHQRVVELVGLSQELWAHCLASLLCTNRLIGRAGASGRMLHRVRQAQYQEKVASELFTFTGLTSGLADLGVEDILDLRRTFRGPVSVAIEAAVAKWPLALGEERAIQYALGGLLTEYEAQASAVVESRRGSRRIVRRLAEYSLDLASIVFWPVGLWSPLRRLSSSIGNPQPLWWFVTEAKARVRQARLQGSDEHGRLGDGSE